MRRVIRVIGWFFAWLIAGGCAAWAFGALYYDFPSAALRLPAALVLLAALVAALIFLRGQWRKLAAFFVAFAVVLAWWFTLQPSNDRKWQPDVERTAWAEVKGNEIVFNNVRNCEYRTETDYTPRWDRRTVHLSELTGMDIAVCYWGSPWMAHPIVSFQFKNAPPLCFSIETRKEVGEEYSAIGGIYRQYELMYIVADERDVVRLRTNFRKGEDVYLYKTTATPEQAKGRLMEYIAALNGLHERARWYNAVTTNCTTAIRGQHDPTKRPPWDWRIIVNGKGDELLYERHGVVTNGLSFAALKQSVHINPRAQAANDSPDFSERIRQPEGAAPKAK